MASHVVVIDSSFRRTTVKTTPGKYLSDVLQEACAKFGLDASLHGLKNNNKPVDISRTVRLSGLSSGAKLELVQLSRSPTVVSVALQVPDSESQGAENSRLTDKFLSTTTLWQILRKFETGSPGATEPRRNFTARGVPKSWGGGTSGAGRLYYEMPILNVMGRELSSFTDLQKTLAQLGLTGGTALLRLSFRLQATPLEEAMEQIGKYFQPDEETAPHRTEAESSANGGTSSEPVQQQVEKENVEADGAPESMDLSGSTPNGFQEPAPASSSEQQTTHPATAAVHTPSTPSSICGPSQRAIAIFAPPSSTTPKAALQNHNDADYEPTIAHAKLHQSRLATDSRNKRLPNHSEVEAQQKADAEKRAQIKEVEIKLRFPDQYQVLGKFTSDDTAETLYTWAREFMDPVKEKEPFMLNFSSGRGPTSIPVNGQEKLIAKLGMTGRILVNFNWDEGASAEARVGRVVKLELVQQAKEIEVKPVEGVEVDEVEVLDKGKGKEKAGGGKGRGPGGMPKWMKLLGKK
ncbi:hypothetical protein MMC30_001116 [Trapelia coarctata]|nr:hypothetical protein [Trapelia coarctata]